MNTFPQFGINNDGDLTGPNDDYVINFMFEVLKFK